MVLVGLVTACRLAGCPTRRSPSLVNATTEGVVRIPSAFSIMRAFLPSIIATHEFVVPRSIPMTLPITLLPFAFGVFRCSILPQSEDCDHRGTSPWRRTRLLLPKAWRFDRRD